MNNGSSLIARMRQALQTAAIRFLDPLFAERHPGPLLLRLIRLLGPVIRQLQPNDRWSIAAFVPSWLKLLARPAPPLDGPAKTIFIFCCYRGQFTLDLVTSILLAWRGHRIVFGYFPKLRSPIKYPLHDSPGVADYLRRALAPVERLSAGRIRCIDLSPCIGRTPVRDELFLAEQIRSDVIMKVRKEHLDPLDPDVREAFRIYETVARDAQTAAWAWLGEAAGQCDLFLIANGASFEAAQFLHVAKACSIPVTSFEKFAFTHARTVTHGGPFFGFEDLDILLEESARIGLDVPTTRDHVVARARRLLDQRRTSSGSAWGWQYQKNTRSMKDRELLGRLGIEKDRFVLICPNVPFDAGYGSWLTLFPAMRDWLEQSVRHLLDHCDLDIVVRAHPAECRPGFDREKVDRILAEAMLASPRLKIVPGDSDINTYDLMPLCRFGLVFASTTGIEIAMHGKPVVAGAKVYYVRCGVTLPVATRGEYFHQVDRAARGVGGKFEREERAAIVYALFHYNLQWPFPYDKPSHVTALPPVELPESPHIADYLRTLDVLAMNVDEFKAELPQVVDLIFNHWS